MQSPERFFNIVLGLSILSWAVFGLLGSQVERPIAVTGSVTILQIVVGILVLIRTKIVQHGSREFSLIAIPAILIGGWALSRSSSQWGWASQCSFTVGTLITITSFLYLGKNFSILPARRQIVVGGPYRIIRHPAYFGELLMILGCALTVPFWFGTLIFVMALSLVAARIIAEENLLISDQKYAIYSKDVTSRLIPWIW